MMNLLRIGQQGDQVVDLSTPLRICDGVLCEEVAGELVLLNLATGKYYGLNAIGTRMWQLIADRAPEQALQALLADFDVDEPQLRLDLCQFCTDLVDQGLLEPAE